MDASDTTDHAATERNAARSGGARSDGPSQPSRSPEPARSPFADLAPRPALEPVLGPLVREPERVDEGVPDAPDDPSPPPPGTYGVARLYGTPDNPVPPDAVPGTVTTADGVVLRTAIIPATARPRLGTIVILQGRNECIEKYFETASDLAALGHAVLAFDWRGQGGSERPLRDPMKGHVRSFREYERDVAAVLAAAAPDLRPPFTLVGHSMGALLALRAGTRMLAGAELPVPVERVVALAPLLRLVEQPLGHRGLKWAMALLRAVGLGRSYAAGGPRPDEIPDFLTNVLTTDPVRHERNGAMFLAHRHLALGGPTVSWVHAAMVAMDRMQSERTLRAVAVPSLLVAAGDDQVVSTPAQERIARRMRNANIVTVDGARHELLQERDRYREQVIAAIHAFAARPAGEVPIEREDARPEHAPEMPTPDTAITTPPEA